MKNNDALLEPLDGYNKVYKDLNARYTEELFDELAKKAKVDAAANKITVREYKHRLSETEKIKNAIGKSKSLKAFLIVLCVILGVAGVALLLTSIGETIPLWSGIFSLVAAIGLIVAFIILIVKKINPKIKQNEGIREKLQAEAELLLKEAWAQMAALNTLYDWNIPQRLVTKTVPLIQMDDNFDEERFTYLRERYGFWKNGDNTKSTLYSQSGSILGNPFLILKELKQSWRQEVYTGSLTIHWTTRVHTKDGTKTIHHSQVLHASVTKPKPVYNQDTYLVYGNEAAPNLTFSRVPSGASKLSEKQIARKVAAGSKKLDKKSQKAVMEGDKYIRLGNDEFEALFGGTDRDNEVEFRLLFTPLAQKSMLRLIKTPEPYGDDFAMRKLKKLNFVRSKHAQGFDYEVDPVNFIHYDFEAARAKFIDINTTYFKSLYFDLAPLISIPLYQQQKTREFIYDMPYASNVSCYEHESIANSFQKELLKPRGSATPSILKTELIKKQGEADSVLITAYAYRGERRVTYIPRWGGDGMTHMVPVVWIEYLPIDRQTIMAVQKRDSTRLDINMNSSRDKFKNMLKNHSDRGAWLYERGVFAMLTEKPVTAQAVREMSSSCAAAADETAMAEVDTDMEELAQLIAAEAAKHDRANNPDTDADELLNDETAETKEVEVAEDEISTPEDEEQIEE